MSSIRTRLGSDPSAAASISPMFSLSSGGMKCSPRAANISCSSRQATRPSFGEKPVLVHLEAHPPGAAPHGYIVLLAPGEMVEGVREFPVRNNPQVGIYTGGHDNACLGIAFGSHPVHLGEGAEEIGNSGGPAGRADNVYIFHYLVAAPQRTGNFRPYDIRVVQQGFVQGEAMSNAS